MAIWTFIFTSNLYQMWNFSFNNDPQYLFFISPEKVVFKKKKSFVLKKHSRNIRSNSLKTIYEALFRFFFFKTAYVKQRLQS